MKSFFLSIMVALESLFGIHSKTVQSVTPAANVPVVSIQAQSTSTIQIPPVITFPLGADILHPSQTYAVTWQNKDPHPVNYSINLEFVLNGDYFIMAPLGIASSTAQTLSFTMPAYIPPKTNYQIYFSNAANKRDVIVGSQAFTVK